jgi:hypothetical protein
VCRLVPETLRKLPRQVVGVEGHESAPDPYHNHMIIGRGRHIHSTPDIRPKKHHNSRVPPRLTLEINLGLRRPPDTSS